MKERKIILASGSPRRAEILRNAGFDFEVKLADVEEISGDDPFATVVFNAALKAEKVAEACMNEELIIAADTLVYCDGKVLGKPVDLEQAKEMLLFLSGKEQKVFTAVCLICGDRKIEFTDESSLYFKELSDEEISDYHQLVNPLDKAGAYNIDEYGDKLIDKLEGSYENVMGLPIDQLAHRLEQF